MTEYHCEECGAAVTEDATECPECGVVFEQRAEAGESTAVKIIGWLIALIIVGAGYWAATVWWDDGEPEAKAPVAVMHQAKAKQPQEKPTPKASDSNYVGMVFAYENLLLTYADMPISTLKIVLDKLRDYDAGLIEDTTELVSWIEEARENVRTAGVSMNNTKIPEGLPDSLAKSLSKYRALLVNATAIRGKVLACYKNVLANPDAECGDIKKMSRQVQAKQEAATKLMKEIIASARILMRK